MYVRHSQLRLNFRLTIFINPLFSLSLRRTPNQRHPMNNYNRHQPSNVVNNMLDVLSKSIASRFKVYVELTKRADLKNYCFTCSIDELAECLGYSRDDLDAILIDLVGYNIIDIRIGYKDSTKRKITLLIH